MNRAREGGRASPSVAAQLAVMQTTASASSLMLSVTQGAMERHPMSSA